MKISVNGEMTVVKAETVETVLSEIGFGDARVATALNGVFLPADERASKAIEAGDQLEVVAPRQGG